MSGELTVVYVAGKGRSGSTLLAAVLGELPGWVTVGEMRFLWRRGLVENRRCGCGAKVADCPFWSQVVAAVDRPEFVAGAGLEAVLEAHDRLFRWSTMPRLLTRRPPAAALATWSAATASLHRAVAEVSGASVLVDSSKWPTDPGLLAPPPGEDPFMVHLVRDPRGVARSWQEEKTHYDLDQPRPMDTYGPLHTSVSWSARNALVELVARRPELESVRLRYEDLTADPERALTGLVARIRPDTSLDGVVDGREVHLSPNHAVAGNPTRFTSGRVTVRADDHRMAELGPGARRLVSALTWPGRRRYGYPARVSSSAVTSEETG